jgi:predicted porin
VNTFVRANNTIGYFLPAMGGLFGQVMVAAGETSTTIANKYTGFRLGYAGGPVSVAGAMGKTKRDNIAVMVDDATDVNFGGSFAIGAATLYAQVAKIKYSKEEQKTAMLGGTYAIGAGTLKVSYTKHSGSTANTVLTNQYENKQIALGYVYDLSKRTALYATYAVHDNGGTATNGANFSLSGSPANPALTRGDSSKGYEFGIRHSF